MDCDKNSSECYSKKEYWDERYRSEESFDWFVKYDSFRHLIYGKISAESRILNLGKQDHVHKYCK